LPRIRHLARIGDDTHPVMRFLSVEPQSEEVDISPWLSSIHWVIQGGEGGDAPLAFDIEWARSMRRACSVTHR
jgi:protein gp37